MTDKDTPRNQGEGDRESARRYSEHTREFIDSENVEEAAREAEKQDPAEAEQAEQAGKERAKEKDTEVVRDYSKPTK